MGAEQFDIQDNQWIVNYTDSDASGSPNIVMTPGSARTIQLIDIAVTTTESSPVLATIGKRVGIGAFSTQLIKFYVEENAPYVPNIRVPITFAQGERLTFKTSASSVVACHFGGKYI